MKPKQKKLKLNKVTAASFVTSLNKDETKKAKGGTWWQGCDIPTINDYSCPAAGTCDTCIIYCAASATCNTDCGTCDACGTWCSECYTLRYC